MKKFKRILFAAAIMSILMPVFAQEIKPGSVATAISNAKGQTSVDYTTGILSYSIPLMSVEQDGYELPLSLNYSATGIKVDDRPGVAGLGWVLGTGAGSITRTLRGVGADETWYYGIAERPIPEPGTARDQRIEDINSNKIDGESDIFTLNIQGVTVKFILAKTGSQLIVKPLQKTDVKIECFRKDISRDKIAEWVVTDSRGNQYFFQPAPEGNISIKYPTPKSSFSTPATTMWNMIKIKLLNNDEINFTYGQPTAESYTSFRTTRVCYGVPYKKTGFAAADVNRMVDSIYAIYGGVSGELDKVRQNLMSIQRNMEIAYQAPRSIFPFSQDLKRIDFDRNPNNTDYEYRLQQVDYPQLAGYLAAKSWTEKVESYYEAVQGAYVSAISNLLYGASKAVSLTDVEDQNTGSAHLFTNRLLRKITFRTGEIEFSYNSLRGFQPFHVCSRIDRKTPSGDIIASVLMESNKKGFLKKIQWTDAKENVVRESSFDYYNEDLALPTVPEYDKDYWGYHNGKVDNKGLLPMDPYYYFNPNGDFVSVFAPALIGNAYYRDMSRIGDRKPDASYAIAKSLKKVTTPEGGSISFEYEGNDVYAKTVKVDIPLGGIRIKAVKVSDGVIENTTQYRYKTGKISNPADQHSTGRLVEWQKSSFSVNYDYPGNQDAYISDEPSYNGKLYNDGSNNGVLYHYVEVVNPDGGVVGYKFAETSPEMHNKPEHNSDLDNCLLAVVSYNSAGKIVQIDRKKYSYPLLNLGDRVAEFDILKNRYTYFTDEGAKAATSSVLQVKKEQIHFNADDLLEVFPSTSSTRYNLFYGGNAYGINPYYDVYQWNFPLRLQHTPKSFVYTIPVEASVLLKEEESYSFQDYDAVAAYTNYSQIDDKAYLYEVLLSSAVPRNKVVKKYSYNAWNYISSVSVSGSAGKLNIKTNKYVVDYAASSNEVIAEMQSQNIFSHVVERQSWQSSDNGNTFQLTDGELFEFEKRTENSRNYFFNKSKYALELAAPLNVSALGYVQTYNQAPPYNVVRWENGQLYKLQERYDWKIYRLFSRLVGTTDKNGSVKNVTLFGEDSGLPVVSSGRGVSADEMIADEYGVYQKDAYYADRYGIFTKNAENYSVVPLTYQQFSAMENVQLYATQFDYIHLNHKMLVKGALDDINTCKQNAPQYFTTQIVESNFYKRYMALLDAIASDKGQDLFAEAYINFYDAWIKGNQNGEYVRFFTALYQAGMRYYAINYYIEILLPNLYWANNTVGARYNFDNYGKLVSDQRDIMHYERPWQSMNVEKAVAAGKKIDLFVCGNAIYYNMRALYADGTRSEIRAVAEFVSGGGVGKKIIDLTSFPNYQQIKRLEVQVTSKDVKSFIALPSGNFFKAVGYLPDCKPAVYFDNNAKLQSVYYTLSGDYHFTRNHDGSIQNVTEQNVAVKTPAMSKMRKVSIQNTYDNYASLEPKIKEIYIADKTFMVEPYTMPLAVMPGQVRTFSLPAGSYSLTIKSDGNMGKIVFNNVTYNINDDEAKFEVDASSITDIQIKIQP